MCALRATAWDGSTSCWAATPTEKGGYNEITFLLKGDGVWTRMKHEGGPHRVQRVPVTESQGRIHTSSATVTVLPEAEEVDVEIDPNDLEIDVYRSGGPGGQSVNTTDSAVRITHQAHRRRRRHAGREESDSRTRSRPWSCCGPACSRRNRTRWPQSSPSSAQSGRRRRAAREDPHLQLQGEPGHPPPSGEYHSSQARQDPHG